MYTYIGLAHKCGDHDLLYNNYNLVNISTNFYGIGGFEISEFYIYLMICNINSFNFNLLITIIKRKVKFY